MSEEHLKPTTRLDQVPVLLEEMRFLRRDLKMTRDSIFAFNRDLRAAEKDIHDLKIEMRDVKGRLVSVETEIFPHGPPEQETQVVEVDEGAAIVTFDEGPPPLERSDQSQIDHAVKLAMGPIIEQNKVLFRELHLDPVASAAEGQSVPPKRADGSRPPRTALENVNHKSRLQIIASGAVVVLITLHETGVFELVKMWFRK
jgi:hypothetical protein